MYLKSARESLTLPSGKEHGSRDSILGTAEGRGVCRAAASRDAIHPEAETPTQYTNKGNDTQQLSQVVVGGCGVGTSTETSTEGQRLSTQLLPWVGSVGRRPLRNGRNARAVPSERCLRATRKRSLPTSRVSRRVDAGASNQSAHGQVRPAHLDLKSIA